MFEKLTKQENDALATILNLSSKEILAIQEHEPTRLFPHLNKNFVKTAYKKLALKWHPDRNKKEKVAAEGTVFMRIDALFDRAMKLIDNPQQTAQAVDSDLIWQNNTLILKTTANKKLIFQCIKSEDFDLGTLFLTSDALIYLIHKKEDDLFNNAVNVIKNLQYPSPEMKAQMQPCLPEIIGTHAIKDFNILIIKKDPQLIRLSDLLNYPPLNKTLEPLHTAWILSRLHNMACHLEWAKLSHQTITLESCYIDPLKHSFALLGDWWYARKVDENILGLQGNLTNFLPHVLQSEKAHKATDFSLIRRLCLQLLGNPEGVGKHDYPSDVPKTMLDWLKNYNDESALVQYKKWKDQIRPPLFPQQRGLIPLKITPQQVYPNWGQRSFSTLNSSFRYARPLLMFPMRATNPMQTVTSWLPKVGRWIK